MGGSTAGATYLERITCCRPKPILLCLLWLLSERVSFLIRARGFEVFSFFFAKESYRDSLFLPWCKANFSRDSLGYLVTLALLALMFSVSN